MPNFHACVDCKQKLGWNGGDSLGSGGGREVIPNVYGDDEDDEDIDCMIVEDESEDQNPPPSQISGNYSHIVYQIFSSTRYLEDVLCIISLT